MMKNTNILNRPCWFASLIQTFPRLSDFEDESSYLFDDQGKASLVEVDAKATNAIEIRLAIAPIDSDGHSGPVFEIREYPVLLISDEKIADRIGTSYLMPLRQSEPGFFDIYTSGECADYPVGSLWTKGTITAGEIDTESWWSLGFGEPYSFFEYSQQTTFLALPEYSLEIPRGKMTHLGWEDTYMTPFDFKHYRTFLIEWPNRYAERVHTNLGNFRHIGDVDSFDGRFAGLFEKHVRASEGRPTLFSFLDSRACATSEYMKRFIEIRRRKLHKQN